MRAGTLALLLLLAALAGAGEVRAHAGLRATSPPDGAVLNAAPDRIELVFSEPVVPLALVLETAEGHPVAARIEVGGDGSTLTFVPERPLQFAAYLVRWRVASADGHPVAGRLAFAVGAVPLPEPVETTGPRLAQAVARTAHLATIVLGAGGALALLTLPLGDVARARSARISRLLLLASLPAAIGRLAATGSEASGLPPSALLGSEPWRAAMATGVVPALAASAGGTLALIAALARAPAPAPALPTALGLLLAAGGFGLTGHTATAPPAAISAPALALHVLSAMGWIGAFIPLALSLRHDPPLTASAVVGRFSEGALLVVPTVLLLGTVLALRQVWAGGGFLDGLWGWILLAKLAAVVGLLLIGAVNRLHLLPRLAAGDPAARSALSRMLAVDLGLAVVLLGATASLGTTPPPRLLASGARLELELALPPLAARVAILPGTAGWNRMEVRLEPPAAPLEVRLVLVPEDGSGEPVEAVAEAASNQAYRTGPVLLVPPGVWRLAVGVLLDPFTRVQLDGRLELP